ncbi:MFS transporter [Epibacterium sp. SM1979]|uniref:MFS transporter n=1 Tax=Tritonibacter litoralis TaxID=2662264 RepID=A0A843YPD5_9RHOB|nr:MFS transporter [Tritonibacter litoralis]MQQ10467.1 MFS transporter [Tritonibacter litoralis]
MDEAGSGCEDRQVSHHGAKSTSFDTRKPSDPNLTCLQANPSGHRPDAYALALVVVGLTLAVTVDALNSTVYGMARHQFMESLSVTQDTANWLNTAFVAAKLTLLPACAWAVNRAGAGPILWFALVGSIVASLLCAICPGIMSIVASRILQGATGAALLVSCQTILFQLFPKSRQGLIQAVFAFGVVVAPASAAPALHGELIAGGSWRWMFALSACVALAASLILFAVRHYLPAQKYDELEFDWVCLGLFAIAMTAMGYALSEGARWNWLDTTHMRWWVAAALVGLIAFVVRMNMRPRRAMFRYDVFCNPEFAFGFAVSLVAGFALFGSAFLIQVFALNVLHLPSDTTARLLLPSSLTIGLALLIAGWFTTSRGANPVIFIPIGVLLVMTSMWMLSGSGPQSGSHDMWFALLLRGLGLGFLFLSLTLVTLIGLPPQLVSAGTGLFNLGRQLGGLIGIACLDTYIQRTNTLNLQILGSNLHPSNPALQQRTEFVSQGFIGRGLDPGLIDGAALAAIQQSVRSQVALLTFSEAFLSLVWLFVVVLPLAILFKVALKKTTYFQ